MRLTEGELYALAQLLGYIDVRQMRSLANIESELDELRLEVEQLRYTIESEFDL